ncbi:phage repressor protein C with HTH and peptisase S24 domain [Roseibium hamelinense]|uniref:Phage repressor protein C with HTH and peptisase S24 domain n=1 Tax=Roseibium hamelinense TaxID=150831 RepID=A0A562STL5_9HYPH|nr:helix-turn-helix transcriptional regulator [Roseibium hamelinense]MTI43050.1 helix-turn-helix transcriptional regulator [Roseibium hamelinense]TWI84647.1 phage repressor protein C with HTH and peptisase S24 domain [Roseibium hamelinense]
MLSHKQVWAAIDALAKRHGFSPSGLARRAGLDPTTFNPSKRFAADGRPRWPSTESLSKILEVTGEGITDLMNGMRSAQRETAEPVGKVRLVPISGLKMAASPGAFDGGGLPNGKQWQQISFPDPSCKNLFALEVSGPDFLPLYRDGDIVVAAPGTAIRRGDRVLVKKTNGDLTILTLNRHTADRTDFSSLHDKDVELSFTHSEIEWTARIVWASQ